MFRFAHIEFLYLLLVIPVLLGIFYYGVFDRKRKLKRFGEKRLLLELMPEVSHIRPRLKFYISLLTVALLIFIAAGPQYGTKKENVKKKGVELVVCVDVSNSMYATDVRPTRMDKAKLILESVIKEMDNNKVALIVFAGESFVQMPMTTDIGGAKMFLNRIEPGIVPVQGTDIAAAITMAENMFSDNATVGKAIIVITDGEDNEGGAEEAARDAASKGIVVDVMGVGTAQGTPFRVKGANDFKKDAEGNTVVTKLNEPMCVGIAQAGGGMYVRADNATISVREINKQLDELNKDEFDVDVYSNYIAKYSPYAVIALVLILVLMCVLDKKNPLFKNVKLF